MEGRERSTSPSSLPKETVLNPGIADGGSHQEINQDETKSQLSSSKMKSKLAEKLSYCNVRLRKAAEDHMTQGKVVDSLKIEVSRIEGHQILTNTHARCHKAYDDAKKELRRTSEKLAIAYKMLQDAFESGGQVMMYRKEYKDAKKSLGEFAALVAVSQKSKHETPKNEPSEGAAEGKSGLHVQEGSSKDESEPMPGQAETEPEESDDQAGDSSDDDEQDNELTPVEEEEGDDDTDENAEDDRSGHQLHMLDGSKDSAAIPDYT